MIDKARGYYKNRPFYAVDENVNIMEGMVAFLTTNAAGVRVATTAASGDVPIGAFYKNSASQEIRSTVESQTFNANNIITLSGGNVTAAGSVKVTNSAGTTTYTQGTDYTVTLANGVITRVGGGNIAAGATVVVSYRFALAAATAAWDKVSTRWSRGVNYDRQPNDTLGSGLITVVEGDAKIFTDQYDVTQTYTLGAALRSNASSLWTSAAAGSEAGLSSACGRVCWVPTANDPFLGLDQIRVVV